MAFDMLIKTATDLGLFIRQRRKQLGWDQARLAGEAGVSRQWLIEVEKGKARAEVGLLLRALNVLGIALHAEVASHAVKHPHRVADAGADSPALSVDIDDIVADSVLSPTLLHQAFDLTSEAESALSDVSRLAENLTPKQSDIETTLKDVRTFEELLDGPLGKALLTARHPLKSPVEAPSQERPPHGDTARKRS